MSKKFNLDDYKGKYVMHCKTEEEAKDFCKVLHEAGRTWAGVWYNSYLDFTKFEQYKDKTCYYFNEGKFSDLEYVVSRDPDGPYTILEWSDLKNFDIVLRRDGDVRIRIGNRYLDKDGYSNLNDSYSSDMTSAMGSHQDIMAIRRPNDISDISFDAFEKKLGRLVYEREETVEMTLEEVCKAIGKNVKIVKE